MDSSEKNIIYLDNRDGRLYERRRRFKTFSKFAGQLKLALLDLYASGIQLPLKLVGTEAQISSFMKSLQGEKRYMDAYLKHGLNDSRTLNSRHTLMRSVRAFELETGLRWPFTN